MMMRTGVVLGYDENLRENFKWCLENDIPTCQLGVAPELQTEAVAAKILAIQKDYPVEITALVGTWSGPAEWNFEYGPETLGIVPVAYRGQRVKELAQCARFAKMLGVPDMCTHVGFIPENPNDPLYAETVAAIRHLAQVYQESGIRFNMETGQETALTLLRVIEDAQAENLGLNFDPANLILYGKSNPIDALGIVGKYVNGVHAKDGNYPTSGRSLGEETPLGAGSVNIPAFIAKLKEIGYNGPVTIEREISGNKQKEDVASANKLLLSLFDK